LKSLLQQEKQEKQTQASNHPGVKSANRINKILAGSPYAIKNCGDAKPTLRQMIDEKKADNNLQSLQ